MAKPRGGDENPVSLFPFLSILACVIGILILLITSVALSQMESDPEEELVARVEEYKELEEKQKQIDDRIETTLPKVHELEQYKEALRKLRERLEQLKKAQNQDHVDQLALKELSELEEELEKNLKAELQDKQKLDAALEKLREEVERRRRVLDAPTVTVLPPSGKGRRSRPNPVFVEANAQGVVLDPAGKRKVIPRGKLSSDAEFKKVVKQVASDRNKVLVILIREDGVASYQVADREARTNGAHVAKLPVLGDGMLDLGRF